MVTCSLLVIGYRLLMVFTKDGLAVLFVHGTLVFSQYARLFLGDA